MVSVGPATWRRVSKSNPQALELAARHYSRIIYSKRGNMLAPPGRSLTYLSADGAAVWVSHWPYEEYALDGLNAFRCSLFRNLSTCYRASDLIVAAMALTESVWGPPPLWLTYVRPDCLRGNPGYCFKVVGFVRDKSFTAPNMHRLLRPAAVTRTLEWEVMQAGTN